ncbi:hypothetical protein EYV94_17260 [Puteibacter caeruleilacunae]|nr:hypothetical protein EYV94_17260 [Puteibacter caeruleilacunae]
MTKKSIPFLIACILLLAGCTISSFFPFYKPDDLIKDDRFVGKWKENNVTVYGKTDSTYWEFKFPEKKKNKDAKEQPEDRLMKLKIHKPQNELDELTVFNVGLFQLGKYQYMDFTIDEMDLKEVGLSSFHLLPVHTISRVEMRNDTLILQWLSSEFIEDMIKQNKIRIDHLRKADSDEDILLTASTEDLQKFILKYEDHPDAFTGEGLGVVLVRNTKTNEEVN